MTIVALLHMQGNNYYCYHRIYSNKIKFYFRLNKIIQCKPDCNFQRLLSVPSCFQNNITSFALNIIQALPPNAAGQCRQAINNINLTLFLF